MNAHQTDQTLPVRERVLGGVIGLVVGDALGVPAEFQPRERLARDPVKGMRGHGSHNQPPGTWSDDSSLALATLVALLQGYDPDRIMADFARWWSEGYMTPHGVVFDIGITTSVAIQRYNMKCGRDEWGGQAVSANGNGSLMRILPLSLFVSRCPTPEIISRSFEISALTHAHIRSELCCAYYSLLVRELLKGTALKDAMNAASAELAPSVPPEEKGVLARVLSGSVVEEPTKNIRGSGYVVRCLEAALWCNARHNSYADTVLAAVNLGEDTDTTAAVAGGLAGIRHGIAAIPDEWQRAIARSEEIMRLANRFADQLCSNP